MRRITLALVVAAALAAPTSALAGGVVLNVQKATNLIAVRTSPAKVALVHTTSAARLRVGQRVAMTTRKLHNGTLAAARVRVVGRAHSTTFRGLLIAKSRTRIVVSAGGAVLALHRSSRSTASARDDHGPQPGSTVTVGVTIADDGELDEDQLSPFSPTSPGGQIEGQITLGTGTITVQAHDATLVLKVPTGFDLTGFQNGDEVLATFSQGTDGSLTVTVLSKDANAQEADDQGDDDGGNGTRTTGGNGTTGGTGTTGGDDGGHGGDGGGGGGDGGGDG